MNRRLYWLLAIVVSLLVGLVLAVTDGPPEAPLKAPAAEDVESARLAPVVALATPKLILEQKDELPAPAREALVAPSPKLEASTPQLKQPRATWTMVDRPGETQDSQESLKAKKQVLGQPCTVYWEGSTRKVQYDAGGLCSVVDFLGPDRHGLETCWYPNGMVRWGGQWKDNKRVGHWDYYDERGLLVHAGEYVNMRRSGEWRSYHPDGSLQSIGSYLDGKREGEWTFYSASGLIDHGLSGWYKRNEKRAAGE